MCNEPAGKNIRLSDGEWKLMNALWADAPKTVAQLVSILKQDTGWTKGTVFMMLSRLGEKGAVGFEQQGKSKQYFPILQQQEAAHRETEHFLSRVYGGSLGMLVASMAGQKALSSTEIDELYAILRNAEQEERP